MNENVPNLFGAFENKDSKSLQKKEYRNLINFSSIISQFLDKIRKKKELKMRFFYPLVFAILLILNGCTGASEENPTITLQGPTDIKLKVGQVIYEPGYKATDPQDGDLTDKVQVVSNINFYKPGEYYVNYSVKDSDGNVARASRIVTIANNITPSPEYSGDYRYGDQDKNYYDFAGFGYLYQVYEEGKTSDKIVLHYDNQGNLLDQANVIFERNKNDKSIYKYINDTKVRHDFIGLEQIVSYDGEGNLYTRHKRILSTGDQYDENGLTCRVIENLATFTTSTITHISQANYPYLNVLHISCSGRGENIEHYYAQGYGEILKVKDGEFYITDKNSINAQLIK